MGVVLSGWLADWAITYCIGNMCIVLSGWMADWAVLLDFSLTVKAAPHECLIKTGQH